MAKVLVVILMKKQQPPSYSQYKEDLLLKEELQAQDSGTCIEVGCYDGVTYSTTFLFEKMGWKCVLIEPNPLMHEKIESVRTSPLYKCAASNRTGSAILQIAKGIEELSTLGLDYGHIQRIQRKAGILRPIEITTRTLDDILQEEKINAIDFITIDVEGFEMNVLEGFSLDRWNPRILIIEDNTNFRDETICRYLQRYGYVRFRRTGCNDWYAKKEDTDLIRLLPLLCLHLVRFRFRAVYWIAKRFKRSSS